MRRAVLAGLIYFGVVFAAGFALGALRVLVLLPSVGEGPAVLLELPIMLTIAWFACRSLVARLDVPSSLVARLVMGAVAFSILMLAEAGVAVFAFGRSIAAHLGHYQTLPALLGLSGQLAFALFPVFQVLRRRHRDG